jgi:alpha-glucosidase
MQGTPFIYQGQELGMANTLFHSLDEFDDVFSHQRIAQMRAAGSSDDDILAELALISRDNSRTPMPWDDGSQAGFSTVAPWIRLNPEYRTINVARQQADPGSTLGFYRRLIELRRREPALLHGRYRLLLKDHASLYVYLRQWQHERIVVICNLRAQPATYRHRGFVLRHADLLLANRAVPAHPDTRHCVLQPWEARAYRVEAATPQQPATESC